MNGLKKDDVCVVCGKKAYVLEHGTPYCYGYWATWGCYYSKEMIDYDRKYYFQTEGKNREKYNAMPLENKERKKMIKYIEDLQRKCYLEISCIPHEELLTWHDEKLKSEVRILENVRANPC